MSDINPGTKEGQTPMYVAVVKGHTEIVQVLLDHTPIDINQIDGDAKTALCLASERIGLRRPSANEAPKRKPSRAH